MSAYGFYIWPCYLMAGVVFVGLILSSILQNRKTLKNIRQKHQT